METYFVRSGGVKEKRVGPDMALYVEARRSIHVLNQTAWLIWEALKDPMTFEELLFVLNESFHAPGDEVRRDLEATLAQFAELGLVARRTVEDGNAVS